MIRQTILTVPMIALESIFVCFIWEKLLVKIWLEFGNRDLEVGDRGKISGELI